MKIGWLFSILLIFSAGAFGHETPRIVKIKIEAPELDAKILLSKLIEHGADHKITFERVDTNYDYKISFETTQEKSQGLFWGSGGSFNVSAAMTSVSDATGKELFKFKRSNRGTDVGATNAVAKEIVKRLEEYWKIDH